MITHARSTALALLAALAMTVSSPISAQEQKRNPWTVPHVLRYGAGEDLVGLNPHFNQQTIVGYLSQMTMAYLVRYDIHNRPVPELATAVPTQTNGGISRDGKTITYHLRRDAKWSDGVPFTAADVAFSIAAVVNPKNNEIGVEDFERILRVDTPDPYTVVLHLKAPYGDFLATYFSTSGAGPCILPKHLLDTLPQLNDAEYNNLPVGIGPFKYVSWKRGDAVELVADPLYFRGRPKLERVIFKIIPDRNTMLTQMQTHELDLWTPLPSAFLPRAQGISGVRVQTFPSYYYNHIDFNVAHGALADPVVRQALRLALDRPTLLAKIFHGNGSLQEAVMPPTHPMFDPHIPLVKFDIAAANRLLDRAGYVRGADGIRAKGGNRLSFVYASFVGSPDTDAMIELIRSWWKQIGAEFTVQRYLAAVFFASYASGGILDTGRYDVTNFAWGTGALGDRTSVFSCRRIPPKGQNMMRYCNASVTRALDDFTSTYDEARQRRDSWFIQEQIARDVPTIVTYARDEAIAYNTDLHGLRTNQASSPFDDMMNVDI
jgi:peptide/nickel transport system substrate-binding protein